MENMPLRRTIQRLSVLNFEDGSSSEQHEDQDQDNSAPAQPLELEENEGENEGKNEEQPWLPMRDLVSSCLVCQKTHADKCGICKIIRYCSKDCQLQDWKRHKRQCKAYLEQNYLEKIKIFKKRLASGEGVAGERLFWASSTGSIRAVRLLLSEDVDVDYIDCDGDSHDSALAVAACSGFVDVVDALIKAGANVNYARSSDGASALTLASGWGNKAVVELLLKASADVAHVIKNGDSALTVAIRNNHLDIVELLRVELARRAQEEQQARAVAELAAQQAAAELWQEEESRESAAGGGGNNKKKKSSTKKDKNGNK